MPATPTSPRLQSVRQQLDDLDALLERMLALPLDALPPSGPKLLLLSDPLTVTLDQAATKPLVPIHSPPTLATPKQETPEEPPAIVAFQPKTAQVEEVNTEPAQVVEAKEEKAIVVPFQPVPDFCVGGGASLSPSSPPPELCLVNELRDTPAEREVRPQGSEHASDVKPAQVAYPVSAPFASIEEKPANVSAPTSFGLKPFQALNAVFDWMTEKGGWMSRWARTPLGKQLLGSTGLFLCIAAAALALGRWLGLLWR